MTAATLSPEPSFPSAHTDLIDVMVIHHTNLPRGRFGEVHSPAGRLLLRQTAAALRFVDVSHRLVTDHHHRWGWPALRLFGSVSHIGTCSATALTRDVHVGIDLQDPRDRPGAMSFLANLIGHENPLSILEYAECESLVKVSELTKETFGSVRLPKWRPGWRPAASYWILSLLVPGAGALCIASPEPRPIRWWQATSKKVGTLGEPVEMSLDEERSSCQQ